MIHLKSATILLRSLEDNEPNGGKQYKDSTENVSHEITANFKLLKRKFSLRQHVNIV